MKLKIRLLYKLSLIKLLFIYGLFLTAIIIPIASLLNKVHNTRTQCDRLKQQWFDWFSRIIKLQITIEGEIPTTSCFIISNHISWLDIVIIGKLSPTYFVAKSDIVHWPVIGFIAKHAGTIFIRRGEKKHIMETSDKMTWLLQNNCTIAAFPEGTTTIGNNVLNFHASLFQPALASKAIIQPVALQYEGAAKDSAPFINDDIFLPHLINMLRLEKIEARITFLPPLTSTDQTRHSISKASRQAIIDQITS
ncbi:MAG: 1-acyl-sn-glycerol-3-phosphate acyltransferase [Methylovulum sp.]|nr:1-acyl-sn-glycerol-3-phosphate acyltransferase [Methylovulum sp.]